ncbi:MAG: FtsX-like permease family protein, partial [Phycisphaerales bacterium]|nr:FtsX-like permease family protein [Phycisphaerales bacterium]
EEDPSATAATPVIDSFGLLKLPYGDQHEGVHVWGIQPESFNRVVDFERSLVWQEPPDEVKDLLRDVETPSRFDMLKGTPDLSPPSPDQDAGIILGVEIDTAAKTRGEGGAYRLTAPLWWMPLHDVELTLVPFSRTGQLEKPFNLKFQVVNEFQSGVYSIDSRRVMIDLATAQRMLNLESQPIFDREKAAEGEFIQVGTSPARAQMILVRAADGVSPEELSSAVTGIYEQWSDRIAIDESRTARVPAPSFVRVRTWREHLRDIIGPVEKERELMRILFSIVYLVCAGLVLSIFWAIVYEKTRDIGVLRSIGASRSGILGLFLTYGLVIGLTGAILGAILAWGVVRNINSIHEALGQPTPLWLVVSSFIISGVGVVATFFVAFRDSLLNTLLAILGSLLLLGISFTLLFHRGFLMWDPSVYYFNEIPNKVDWFSGVLTMAGAIFFSVLGAAIPAARAADVDPVRALRYE